RTPRTSCRSAASRGMRWSSRATRSSASSTTGKKTAPSPGAIASRWRQGEARSRINKAAGKLAALFVSASEFFAKRLQPFHIWRAVRRVGADGLAHLRRARRAQHFALGLVWREAGGIERQLAEREQAADLRFRLAYQCFVGVVEHVLRMACQPERAEAFVVAVVLGDLVEVVAVMHAVPEQVTVAGEAGFHRVTVAVDDSCAGQHQAYGAQQWPVGDVLVGEARASLAPACGTGEVVLAESVPIVGGGCACPLREGLA